MIDESALKPKYSQQQNQQTMSCEIKKSKLSINPLPSDINCTRQTMSQTRLNNLLQNEFLPKFTEETNFQFPSQSPLHSTPFKLKTLPNSSMRKK